MKTRRVNRYWCDHCHKGGCSAGAMAKHEKHCCKNPNRSCRMCGKENTDVKSNMEFLRNDTTADGVKKLEARVDGCPACTLAAVIMLNRVDNLIGEEWVHYDYHEAVKDWWQEKNNASQLEEEYRALQG